jgi:hypothetical protein
MFNKDLMKHLKDSGSRFTELHAKLDMETLLNFAIALPLQTNKKKH